MDNWEMKGKPALVIVHMQRGVIAEDDKSVFRELAETTKRSGIIPRQQALLEGFRRKKLPVIYIVAALPEQVTTFPAYGKFWELMGSVRPNPSGSKDVEVVPELTPQPGEPVLGNWPIGGFSNTNLEQILEDYSAETLVLVGVATEHAVLATTQQAADLGYSAIVPSDASTSANARAHELVMSDILPGISLATNTEDVLAHI
jgi:nicotinamidase-related amidase